MTERVPEEIEYYVDAYVNNENTLGFNHSTTTDDETADYQLKHWTSTADEVTVGLWIANFGIVQPHAQAFTQLLQEYGFECKTEFHEVEDDYADHMNHTAYEASFRTPN